MTAEHPLDSAAYSALSGPHAHFAERKGRALRYPSDVAPFYALPPAATTDDWDDLAALAGPGEVVSLGGTAVPVPDGWADVHRIDGVQLVDAGMATEADDTLVRLTVADVPAMLALVGRTQPGPFRPRTIELGTYLGIRHDGELIAMAGERLHLPGWTEISAVCTDARFRGQGLGTRLIRAVAHGIRARGETPFLHAAASNVSAIGLYESLGFRLRRTITFQGVRVSA